MIQMNLKKLLSINNMSQKELANLANVRPGTISNYCNNNWVTINREHLDKFCEVLNCNISDLITYESSSSPKTLEEASFKTNKPTNKIDSDSFTNISYKYIFKELLKDTEIKEKITDSVMKILLDTPEDNQKDKDDE